MHNNTEMVDVLNISIHNISSHDLLKRLEEGFVVTPNVDHLMQLQNDKEFYDLYQKAEWIVCDSKLVQWSSKFLGRGIIEKISGSDFFPAFYNYHQKNDKIKIFLLGAAEGVANKAKNIINNKIGRNIIVDAMSPTFGFEKNEEECMQIIERINNTQATVLAVGVGAPKQEKWIFKYKDQMPNVKIFMAIGATIDFEAGNVKRAPRWMSSTGIEWLYRLVSEPRRLWKRYLVEDMPFFWLIIKQKLGLYKNPWKS